MEELFNLFIDLLLFIVRKKLDIIISEFKNFENGKYYFHIKILLIKIFYLLVPT